MSFESLTLAYRRWQVALAVRDRRWRTLSEIRELVGFDATICLTSELRGSTNFERRGDKWRLKEVALAVMEHAENTPRSAKPNRARPQALRDRV